MPASGERPAPVLSVVIVVASDSARPRADPSALRGCLEAFHAQRDAPPFELIVPVHDALDGVEELARRFPDVRFLPVEGPRGPSWTGPRVHHHTLRARGLRAARGELLALAEDHARPDPHWCARVVAHHRERPVAAVAGAIENGIDRPLQWAVYLCDFARYQNPVPEGPSALASDINVAYARDALASLREEWEDGFYEVRVNEALRRRGHTLRMCRDVVMLQWREGLGLRDALIERFAWGRSYAAVRSAGISAGRRWTYALLCPLLPLLLTARIGRLCGQRGGLRRLSVFAAVLPWLLLLEAAWSAGEAAGYAGAGSGRP